MAWLTVADGTGAIQCALFPGTYEQVIRYTPLREGALVLVEGRLAQEDSGGPKLFADTLRVLGGKGARLSALAVSLGAEGD